MRIYIGSSDRNKAKEAAVLLGHVHGHELTSHWFDLEKPKAKDVAGWAARAAENYAALDQAEAMVGMFFAKYPGPGVHAETGYALGRGLPVIVYAPLGFLPTPMFNHPRLKWVTTADELEAAVKQLAEEVASRRVQLLPGGVDPQTARDVMEATEPKPTKTSKPRQKKQTGTCAAG